MDADSVKVAGPRTREHYETVIPSGARRLHVWQPPDAPGRYLLGGTLDAHPADSHCAAVQPAARMTRPCSTPHPGPVRRLRGATAAQDGPHSEELTDEKHVTICDR